MAKLTREQAEKMTSSNSSYFQLKNDGDHAKVQIMANTVDDIPAYSVHKVQVDGKFRTVGCLREEGDPIEACPLCAAGSKLEVQWYVPLFDIEDQTVKIWNRGKSILETLRGLANHYNPMSSCVVDIERHGAAGQNTTRYGIYPLPQEQAYDLSSVEVPEIEGTVITLMTVEEMNDLVAGNDYKTQDDSQVKPRAAAPAPKSTAAPARRVPAGNPPPRRNF